jgi:predicted RNA-binding Zn-ribbon protein involved in translation (DUF1610 family)
MALPEINAKCASCGHSFRAKPTRTFLAFQKMKCPKCSKDVIYPLTSGYRTTYWVIVMLMIIAFLGSLGSGQIAMPGLLGFAAIIALIRDAKLRKTTSPVSAAA